MYSNDLDVLRILEEKESFELHLMGNAFLVVVGVGFLFEVLLAGNLISVQNGISGKLSSMEDLQDDLCCLICWLGVVEFGIEA